MCCSLTQGSTKVLLTAQSGLPQQAGCVRRGMQGGSAEQACSTGSTACVIYQSCHQQQAPVQIKTSSRSLGAPLVLMSLPAFLDHSAKAAVTS